MVECCICLDIITNDNYKTKCNHIFHLDCIYKLTAEYLHTKCPLCKYDLNFNKIKHSYFPEIKFVLDNNVINTTNLSSALYYTNIIHFGHNTYSFSLYPEHHQPTGIPNFSYF